MTASIYLTSEQESVINDYIAAQVAAVPQLAPYLKPLGVVREAFAIGLTVLQERSKSKAQTVLPLVSESVSTAPGNVAAQADTRGRGKKQTVTS